ncbi:unnamed protein product [Alopecurus aequalis]
MFSCFLRSRRTQNKGKAEAPAVCDGDANDENRYVDPPQFTLRLLTAATDNFDATNRLGVQQQRERDLGPVFKGKLEDGQVVAVRRVPARYIRRQFHELRDELLRAAELKHDNIVQLLGVCLERGEKLLVYEYLPNASLDTILSSVNTEGRRRRHLDWEKRYSIIRGIARGLTYLHDESGQGINLKGILRPSKVLLDADMNPKILDAGIIPPPNAEELDHTFVLDTTIYRYAAPEWVTIGRTSTKSDMFSFGVILLEVVTGQGMYHDWRNGNPNNSGLTYVWDKWNAGSVVDIADALLGHRYPLNEMCNCVHIGLLCLQEDQKLRPDASTVMQALDTSSPTSLPTPSIPYGYRV